MQTAGNEFLIPRSRAEALEESHGGYAVPQALTEAIVDSLGEGDEVDVPLERATAGQRAVFSLYAAMNQIDNGGLRQFFEDTGVLAEDAIAGAKLLGAEEHARILREASAEDDYDRLDELTEQWFSLEPLEGYFTRYVASHPDEFFVSQ